MHGFLTGAIAGALLVACAPAKPRPTLSELAVHYDRCYAHDQAHEIPNVVTCLNELEARGWTLALQPHHFEASRDDPAFQALARRWAETVPRVQRSQLAFTAPAELVPENVAFDPKTGAFFLGSLPQRKIVRVSDGRVEDFTRPDLEPGLMAVLGMKIDPARRTLWAATAITRGDAKGRSALELFDVDTGARLARFAPDDAGAHLFNDVAITAAEDVYVTDSVGGGVYRVSGRGGLQVFLPPKTLSYPNGIALSGDEKTLYIAHEHGVAVVDVATRTHAALRHPPNIPTIGVDGLYFHRDALIAVQGGMGRARIVRWRFDGARIYQLELLEAATPQLESPSTGVIVNDRFYYIANFQNTRLSRDGRTPKRPLDPVRVLSVPLD